MKTLYETLEEYKRLNIVPFHMPGHKRNEEIMPRWNLWEMDFTEVSGLDNLHCAEGIIKDAQKRMARLFGVRAGYFMVNGSTGGILAAISACVKHRDKIIVARNCHKSVYNAIYLNELTPAYVYPEVIDGWEISGGIEPSKVERVIEENPEAKAVVITSPTYEGIVSDIAAIAQIAHAHGMPLIVDEAHGAHFKFMDNCPKSATECGADFVIQSFHKTLPSLTQTAVLHFNAKGNAAAGLRQSLENYLKIYQTSSPSYLFLASMDWCLDFMCSKEEKRLEAEYWSELNFLKEKIKNSGKFRIMDKEITGRNGVFGLDPSKLVIAALCGAVSGMQLEEKFISEFSIQAEMSKGKNILFMTSVADKKESFKKLREALEKISLEFYAEEEDNVEKELLKQRAADVKLNCYDAVNSPNLRVAFDRDAVVGKISAEYVYLYPPGIPFLVPGELITEEIYRAVLYCKSQYAVKGESDQRRLLGMQDINMDSLLIVDS